MFVFSEKEEKIKKEKEQGTYKEKVSEQGLPAWSPGAVLGSSKIKTGLLTINNKTINY